MFRLFASALLAPLVFAANAQDSTEIRYPASTEFPVGDSPISVTIADLDSDGIPDVLTANRFSHNVSVLLGQGNGDFHPVATLPTGSEPTSVAVGDFNGDTVPDLVTANSGSDSISVFAGRGNGSYRILSNYTAGDRPAAVVIGDFDGDQVADFAVSNSESDDVSVWLGRTGSVLQPLPTYPVGERPVALTAADLNGDGAIDLVTANFESDDLSILRGTGDGTFQPWGHYEGVVGPVSVRAADVNRDGALDLVTIGSSVLRGSVSLFLGRGDGTFQTASTFAEGKPSGAVVVADFNNDDNPDLLVTRSNFVQSFVSLMRGRGDGTFEAGEDFATGDLPVAVAVADLNADSVLDLVTANYDGNDVSILLGNNEDVPEPEEDLMVIADSLLTAFSTGDADEDGVLSYSEASTVLPNLSRPSFDGLDSDQNGFLSETELEAQNTPETDGGCMLTETTTQAGKRLGDLFLLGLTLISLWGAARLAGHTAGG